MHLLFLISNPLELFVFEEKVLLNLECKTKNNTCLLKENTLSSYNKVW